jgi:hypothetical protein
VITLGGMDRSLIEARKRLPSLPDLDQAAVLLNIPGLDEAERNTGAALHYRQAALLARIADWAAAARAAREIGELDFGQVTTRYAYLIETVDEHDRGWWQASGGSAGIEDSPSARPIPALMPVTARITIRAWPRRGQPPPVRGPRAHPRTCHAADRDIRRRCAGKPLATECAARSARSARPPAAPVQPSAPPARRSAASAAAAQLAR